MLLVRSDKVVLSIEWSVILGPGSGTCGTCGTSCRDDKIIMPLLGELININVNYK